MDHEETFERKVVIIGAGPAGLTAAYELVKLNTPPLVIEKSQIDQLVETLGKAIRAAG